MTAVEQLVAPDAGARRRPRHAVLVLALLAGLTLVGVLAGYAVFVRTATGQQLEQVSVGVRPLGRRDLVELASIILSVVSVGFVLAATGTTATIALLRRRPTHALAAAVLVAGSITTTELLKLALPRPDRLGLPWRVSNSYPSGHTTVAASIAFALLLVVPARSRPSVAWVGAVYAAATGVSTLVGGWHRPSDVVGALLVVLAWACVTAAGIVRRSGVTRRRSAPPPTLVLGALGLIGLLLAGVAMEITWLRLGSLDLHRSFPVADLGAALGVGGVAACATAVWALVVERADVAGEQRPVEGAAL